MISEPDPRSEQERFEELRQILHAGGAFAHWVVDAPESNPATGLPYQHAIWFRCDSPPPVPDGKRKVFFTVNPCFQIPPTNARGKEVHQRQRHSQNAFVGCVNALYAEFDNKDFGDDEDSLAHIASLSDQGIPLPSACTHSGGGYQCFWLLVETFFIDSEEARSRISYAQAAWVDLTDGDPGVHDLRRILRVPGTWNIKERYGPDGKLCHFVKFDLDLRYSLAELEALLPEPEPETDRERLEEVGRRRAHIQYADDLVTRYIDDELAHEYDHLVHQIRGGRSAALVESAMKLAGILKADWAAGLLTEGNIYHELLRAADDNGLVRDYGRAEIEREIGNGIRQGDARLKPSLARRYPEYFESSNRRSGAPQKNVKNETSMNPPPPPPDGPRINLLDFEATDEGNAEAVHALHGERFRHVAEWGWLYYTGTHWERDGAEKELGFAVVRTLRQRRVLAAAADYEAVITCSKPNAARVGACITMLQKHVWATPDQFDRAAHLLNVANGVLDLRDGTLQAHDPAQRFTYCVTVEYNPQADTSFWTRFLNSVLEGNGELAEYLQEAVGYSLTGETNEECLFYIWGPTRSGKGAFTETLLHLLGKPTPLASEVDFNLFTAGQANPDAQNFALAPLRPCRMVFASETGRYQSLNEAKVKLLTGGNDVRCCFKGKDHFSYRPQFKIWLSSNERPKGDVDDDALWRSRLKVIEFPHSFAGREDKTLKRRLCAYVNLQGVLRWAVEGAHRWYARPQGLATPQAVEEATQRSRDELDTVQQWLDECCERAQENFVSNALIQTSYGNWCSANGHKARGGRSLGRALSSKGFEPKFQRVGTAPTRGWVGLRLSSDDAGQAANW